jgi:hypothetical protein
MTTIIEQQRVYQDEVHRVSVTRSPGEALGLTVKVEGECVVVSRIIEGGLIDRIGLFDLGDIIVEVGGVPIETVDDLMYQVSVSGKKITFLIKKTPAEDLKKLAIAQTPSLRKQINKEAPQNHCSTPSFLLLGRTVFSSNLHSRENPNGVFDENVFRDLLYFEQTSHLRPLWSYLFLPSELERRSAKTICALGTLPHRNPSPFCSQYRGKF